MVKNRIILVVIVCFSVAGFAGQPRQGKPPGGPRMKKAMTDAEKLKMMESFFKPMLQREERDRERRRLMRREAWKRLLRISEWQWKIIKTKVDKVNILGWRKSMRASVVIDRRIGSSRWRRPSRRMGWWPPAPDKTPDELTESEKIVEELIDVLEDENSKDKEIRKKMDALQQFREKARREFAKVGQEMAAVLTTPHQEAVLLLMGYID